LLNALGEFALTEPEPRPSTGVLVRVLEEVGIGRHAARQAIHRCSQSGWITGQRSGREFRWEVTPTGRELLSDGIARVEALGTDHDHWDDRWLVIVASIPQDRRGVRDRFYRALRWNGFGSPMPGLWISAHHDREARVAAAVRRSGLDDCTAAFTGTAAGLGLPVYVMVAKAWDLNAIADRYRSLTGQFARRAPGRPAEAMAALLELDEELQTAPSWDPHLPAVLAPGWSGRDDAAQLLTLRSRWMALARERWHELQS
jgi:phenylacetic acid degradation operon negative regulatory protein